MMGPKYSMGGGGLSEWRTRRMLYVQARSETSDRGCHVESTSVAMQQVGLDGYTLNTVQ